MKPKVLFVREKWSDGNPGLGKSDGNYMIPTLESSGVGEEPVIFYYDEGLGKSEAGTIDEQLLKIADHVKPDLIVFSHLLSWGEQNIRRETFSALRHCGMKVVGVWHEGVAPDVIRVADEMIDCVDFHVVLDTKEQHLKHTKFPEKYLGLYDPRDPAAFSDPGLPRDRLMSFVGTMLGRAHRCFGIAMLWANGIPCDTIGREGGIMPPEQYVDLLRRSKMGVNFADAGNGDTRHYKGRVAEVLLCGACLFERKNPEIQNILEPFIDYVEWETFEDLVDKVRYYARFEDERARIAERGKAKAQELLTGKVFWKAIFERAGVG